MGVSIRKAFLVVWLFLLFGFISIGTLVKADCVCTCVNGEVTALCSSSLDIAPICAPRICPLTPPSIAPIQSPKISPLGTTSCRQMQVLNAYTLRYEWKRVCQ